MMEEVRVQECWALGIAEIQSPVSELLPAMDYTLNGNQMIQNIIQDSKLASIRRVSHNCMIIEIPHYIMEKIRHEIYEITLKINY